MPYITPDNKTVQELKILSAKKCWSEAVWADIGSSASNRKLFDMEVLVPPVE